MTKRRSLLQKLIRPWEGLVGMALTVAIGLGAVATLGDRGWLVAVPVLAGGFWLARRRGDRAGRAERMTTDPWQVEEPPRGRGR